MAEPGDVLDIDGVAYVYRTVEELKDLIEWRTELYAEGKNAQGDTVGVLLKHTVLLT